jgi:proline iminopeptidase
MLYRFKVFFILIVVLTFSCSKKADYSGILNIPDSIFEYKAEGQGIPCVVFTGVAYNKLLGDKHKLYSDNLRKEMLLIHANALHLGSEDFKDVTLDTIVDDIDKVRKALGLEKISVMGHSKYGPIPLEYAVKYPGKCDFTVVTGGKPTQTQSYYETVDKYWTENATGERKDALAKNLQQLSKIDMTLLKADELFKTSYSAFIPRFFYDFHFDLSPVLTEVQYDKAFDEHFGNVLMKDFDHSHKYNQIKSPVLVIAGRYDFSAPYFLWDDVKEIIPDFTFYLFENAGHNPMIEVPEQFDKVVIDWVKDKK